MVKNQDKNNLTPQDDITKIKFFKLKTRNKCTRKTNPTKICDTYVRSVHDIVKIYTVCCVSRYRLCKESFTLYSWSTTPFVGTFHRYQIPVYKHPQIGIIYAVVVLVCSTVFMVGFAWLLILCIFKTYFLKLKLHPLWSQTILKKLSSDNELFAKISIFFTINACKFTLKATFHFFRFFSNFCESFSQRINFTIRRLNELYIYSVYIIKKLG